MAPSDSFRRTASCCRCISGASSDQAEERIPGKRGRILFAAFLFALFAGELLFIRTPNLSERELRIVMLDVGQGDCFLLSSGKNHVLLDCGSSSREDVGEEVLLPALRYYGIGTLQALILTHGDSDHVNGIPPLLPVRFGRRG